MPFRVGLTSDLRGRNGGTSIPCDLTPLDRPGIAWGYMAEHQGRRLTPDHVRGYDAVLVMAANVTADVLTGADRLALISLQGAGLDRVDLDEATRRGVIVTNTSMQVAAPMAQGMLLLLLALAHDLPTAARIGQSPGWPARHESFAPGVIGRTIGIIGFGAIGREFARVVEPLGARVLAYSPRLTEERAWRDGAERADLDVLMSESDFVCMAAPLTDGTRGLLDRRRIGLMKDSAFLINVGRGPLIDEPALVEALRERRIAGAALDVLCSEPLAEDNPLAGLDNVILTPHKVGVTRQFFEHCMASAVHAICNVAEGRLPDQIVNPSVLEQPTTAERLETFRTAHADASAVPGATRPT